LTAGFNRFEFAAEALLNLAKSLQSTFGESRDEVRAELEKLQIFSEAEIEFRNLYARLLEKLEAGKYCLRPDVASVLSSDKEAILRRLGKNIKPRDFRKFD